jgi:hypothetical protein
MFLFKRVSPVFVFVVSIFAIQTAMANPTPIAISGNPSCATLNASSDPAFAHITENYEFKVDPPIAGTMPLTGGGVGGGMSPNANLFLSLAYSNDKTLTSWTLTPTQAQYLDRLVSAVIVKGGPNGANVYPYNPLDNGDSGTFTVPGGSHAISHLSFCFELQLAPSAADSSVSGRVVDYNGRPISSASVVLVDLFTGQRKVVMTNTLGYYKFEGLETMGLYNLDVTHRRYKFNESVRTFSLQGDLTNVNFSAAR